MNLSSRVLVVSVIDISVTDSVVYYHLQRHPENLTIPFLFALIFITILPIVLVLLYWRYQQHKK